jgi:DNA polymerase-3 subunit delta
MGALKAGDIDAFLRAPDIRVRFLLVYGPDGGLVAERAGALAKAHLKGSADPLAVTRLEGEAMAGDPGRLLEEIHASALFTTDRVVRLRDPPRQLQQTIEQALGGPEPTATLIVEAGDLKGGAPLRKAFEGARSALAIPCYADEARDLDRLVGEEMEAAGLKIAPDAKRLLVELLGGDRMASRQELRKIALYCHGATTVTAEDVAAISGDIATIGNDALVDAMGQGDMAGVAAAFRKLTGEGNRPDILAGAALRHVGQLSLARAEVDRGRTAADAVRGLIPPVFYKRTGVFERQLVLWTVDKAERAARALQQAVLDARRQPRIADTIVERALLSAASLAKRRG